MCNKRNRVLLLSMVLGLLNCSNNTTSDPPVFRESFEDLTSMRENGAIFQTQVPDIAPGLVGNSADFAGSRSVCYPAADKFNLNAGTVQFWVLAPETNGLGYFDIGGLGSANSIGLFKNVDHFIMEVKNNTNSFDQAWQPRPPVDFDGKWHLVSAMWETDAQTTKFRVCHNNNCKDEFDGTINNTLIDTTGNFCVAWSGYYGYSDSRIDEFKLFDYTKSNIEVISDYEALKADLHLSGAR